jgi:hypothetical protein
MYHTSSMKCMQIVIPAGWRDVEKSTFLLVRPGMNSLYVNGL